MFGYRGAYLKIALSGGRCESVPIPPGVLQRVIGGAGLGTWLLHRECPPGIDPFDPACPVVFAWAPLAGSGVPGSTRFAVVTKSPLTGRLNDAICSSRFAEQGRGCGADGWVIVGACATLSVLLVEPVGVRVEAAPELAGLSPARTAERVRERFGERFSVAAIGLAGENRVRYATLSAEGRHAGRGGTGAVLGAKGLKAIAVAGGEPPTPADPERLAALVADLAERAGGEAMDKYRRLGTLGKLGEYGRLGVLPTPNFRGGPTDSGALSAAAFARSPGVTQSLPPGEVALESRYRDKAGRSGRMEYENVSSLGPLCGVSDRETVQAAIALCDEYGLDTISTGATLAFAMECAARELPGIPEEVARLGLAFGNGETLLPAIEAIARNTGGGALLAEGTRRLAHRIGPESEAFAPHVKGLELPAYDPRAVQTLALALAVGARGADHNRSNAYEPDLRGETDRLGLSADSVRAAAEAEERAVLMDSLILSKFLRGIIDFDRELPALLGAVSGEPPDRERLRGAARYILDLKKDFNQQQGWSAAEDTLPERFFRDEPGAPAPIDRGRFRDAVAAYYRLRGWDAAGRVTLD